MLARSVRIEPNLPRSAAIVLGTLTAVQKLIPGLHPPTRLREDAFWLTNTRDHEDFRLVVTAKNDRGVLYGVFSLLNKIAQHQPGFNLDEVQQPYEPVRWIDQWDNLDGSSERGYAGRSIFFENGTVRADLGRAADRLLDEMDSRRRSAFSKKSAAIRPLATAPSQSHSPHKTKSASKAFPIAAIPPLSTTSKSPQLPHPPHRTNRAIA
jgi:hypothetical protein